MPCLLALMECPSYKESSHISYRRSPSQATFSFSFFEAIVKVPETTSVCNIHQGATVIIVLMNPILYVEFNGKMYFFSPQNSI